RDRLELDDLLFSYTGNVVFANVAAARKMAQALNKARGSEKDPERVIHAGALYAMGMIDELNHALIARFRKEKDPEVLSAAVRWLRRHADSEQVEKLLRIFTERFPNTPVYRGKMTVEEWLLLWLANINPAFKPFRELYSDTPLREQTMYGKATEALPEYFKTRPKLTPQAGSLLDALQAPMKASPDSLTGQLDFIREHWKPYLGADLKRVMLAIDTLREEDIAIWMMFHP